MVRTVASSTLALAVSSNFTGTVNPMKLDKPKLNKILIIAAMSMLPLQHAFCGTINRVQVQVVDTNGGTSPVLLERMGSSMQVVADQLFLDHDVDYVKAGAADYQRLLAEIGDRVFTGYELRNVDFSVGQVTTITMYARPWSGTIAVPEVDLQFSGVEPKTAKLLESHVPGLKEQIGSVLQGASVDASDWAGGVLRRLVRQEVERQLPEFKAAVDVFQNGGKTTVQVIIYPVGQLVNDVRYELRSEAIPNILLMELKYKYDAECDRLRGLPVEYVHRHKEMLEQRLTEQILSEPEVKNFGLQPKVVLSPGPDLGVDIVISSDDYKIWFEGYGDMGREEDNLSGKAHIGKFVSKRDELFGEAEVVLDDVEWRFGIGAAHYWGKSSWSYMRRMPVGDNDYKLEYSLSPKWRLRAEHFSGDDRNEFGVRYRIHEFLSAEYVYGGDEFYLRIIGNL